MDGEKNFEVRKLELMQIRGVPQMRCVDNGFMGGHIFSIEIGQIFNPLSQMEEAGDSGMLLYVQVDDFSLLVFHFGGFAWMSGG